MQQRPHTSSLAPNTTADMGLEDGIQLLAAPGCNSPEPRMNQRRQVCITVAYQIVFSSMPVKLVADKLRQQWEVYLMVKEQIL